MQAHAQAQALVSSLREAAESAKEKFQKSVQSDTFGQGLSKPMVDEMVADSVMFWDALETVDASDIEDADDEESTFGFAYLLKIR